MAKGKSKPRFHAAFWDNVDKAAARYDALPDWLKGTKTNVRIDTMGIKELQKNIHQVSVNAGWYSDIETGERIERNVPEMIALMHSELSEALEGYRKRLPDTHLPKRSMIEVEFADVIIRVLDTAEYLGLDVEGAIVEKMAYNQTREDHKIENRMKADGKRF